MVDEPKGNTYGGLVAGPVFSEVGEWALNNMHVQPDLRVASSDLKLETVPDKGPASQSNVVRKPIIEETADMESSGGIPDFNGQTIRQVLKKGKSLGLDVIVDGTGTAVMQSPAAGTPLEGITSINVTFKPAV
jgi:cell division protein FtsI (penicillin-binding protein 3)